MIHCTKQCFFFFYWASAHFIYSHPFIWWEIWWHHTSLFRCVKTDDQHFSLGCQISYTAHKYVSLSDLNEHAQPYGGSLLGAAVGVCQARTVWDRPEYSSGQCGKEQSFCMCCSALQTFMKLCNNLGCCGICSFFFSPFLSSGWVLLTLGRSQFPALVNGHLHSKW